MAAAAKSILRVTEYHGNESAGGKAKSILVTSPGAGEGRTSFVANLVTVMAQAGRKVVVVDCDFRNPALHRVFATDNRNGLSSILMGLETSRKAIRPSDIEGVDVIPAGPVLAQPGEMLNAPQFAELVAELSAQYDHIVLDSPAVSAGPDARIAAASCDVTILLVGAGKSNKKAIAVARESLSLVGANVLGLVINDAPPRLTTLPAPKVADMGDDQQPLRKLGA
jgi:capsular exopolysaccharide synthesis family protein